MVLLEQTPCLCYDENAQQFIFFSNQAWELNCIAAQLELAQLVKQSLVCSGKTGVTLVDLRATHCRTHKTCLPHEVKPPWAEACDGSNLSELMQDAERKKTMARPAAQILYYMARPWSSRSSCVKPCKHILHVLMHKSYRTVLTATQARES